MKNTPSPIDYFQFRIVNKVSVETFNMCNRSCSFCPRSTHEDTGEHMSIENFSNLLSQLKYLEYEGDFSPALTNEPLCDDRIVELVELARGYLPESLIRFDTNGDLLTERLFFKLVHAGLGKLVINLYDENKELRRFIAEHDHMRDMIYVVIRTIDDVPLYNRAGIVDVDSDINAPFCHKIFHKIALNWKGDMLLCCADYNHEVIIGNVFETGIAELWNSHIYNTYRESHSLYLGHLRTLCNRCNRLEANNG